MAGVFSMIHLGIIGFSASGKTTLFNALTGSNLTTGQLTGEVEVQKGAVDVPDPRLDAVSQVFEPRKTTLAKVVYSDVGGLRIGMGREGLPGPLLDHLEQMDGLLHVVRSFDDPQVPRPEGGVDPRRDIETLEAEFLLHDMLILENRLNRLADEQQKGARDRSVIDTEMELLNQVAQGLNQGTPVRDLELSRVQMKSLSGFGLLSRKPILVLLNTAEGSSSTDEIPETRGKVVSLQGKLEMEIAQLESDDVEAFLEEYGLEEMGRDRVIKASIELLNLITFFTGNEDEVRAWIFPKGGTALEAAGMIHSDLERGFIRAEVIRWDELTDTGGMSEARSQGRVRVEGKEYLVVDGDVVYIRFNI